MISNNEIVNLVNIPVRDDLAFLKPGNISKTQLAKDLCSNLKVENILWLENCCIVTFFPNEGSNIRSNCAIPFVAIQSQTTKEDWIDIACRQGTI